MPGQDSPESLAVIDGVRTPFAKAFGVLASVPADELARIAVTEVLKRADIPADRIDEVIFGNVAGPADASNVARVIALRAGIPQDRIAHTVNRNCASGMEAVISASHALREGRAESIIAGGTESMSNIPLLWDDRMTTLLTDLRKARNVWSKLKTLFRLRPSYFKPIPALLLGLTDPVCGLNMGKTAEVLAKEFSISREQQDRFALASHQSALAAGQRGFFTDEIVPVPRKPGAPEVLDHDNGPRENQSLEKLAKLKPIFEPELGTVTAGNSCQVTDGAAAMILMQATRAQQLGIKPLGFLRAHATAGCDPRRMGLGPVFAVSKLLQQTGLNLDDFDLVEINEAFAVQVLACVKAMNSDTFAREELGRDTALGEIDIARLNVNGGAIALGHPVGTSGARLVITLLRALREKGLRRGLASLCVGGGQGMALLLETELD